MQAGMLTGRSLLGGSALIMAAAVGDGGLIVAVVLVVWSSLALLLCSREPPTPARNREGMRTFGAQLVAAVKRRSTVLGLLFAALAGAGFEAVGAVAGPFLIDRGVAEDQIGWFFTVVSVPCMIAGALVGGPLSDRLGKRRAVAILLVTLASAIVALALGDASLPPLQVAPRLALLAVVYVAIGLFTAASYALFMDLTDVRLAATQFTAFMALTNVCESWSSFAVGRLVPAYGACAAGASSRAGSPDAGLGGDVSGVPRRRGGGSPRGVAHGLRRGVLHDLPRRGRGVERRADAPVVLTGWRYGVAHRRATPPPATRTESPAPTAARPTS
jgi:nitrate/nitrite transporter NarK